MVMVMFFFVCMWCSMLVVLLCSLCEVILDMFMIVV